MYNRSQRIRIQSYSQSKNKFNIKLFKVKIKIYEDVKSVKK